MKHEPGCVAELCAEIGRPPPRRRKGAGQGRKR
jgi:hypothetical protein